MSRALNIDATQDHVRAACSKHGASISTIETLPGGCTRVVLRSGDSAAIVSRHYGAKVLTGPQRRTPLSLASRDVPLTGEQRAAPAPVPSSAFPGRRG